jgi:nuclear polyadenylated RNA-binding protein 3
MASDAENLGALEQVTEPAPAASSGDLSEASQIGSVPESNQETSQVESQDPSLNDAILVNPTIEASNGTSMAESTAILEQPSTSTDHESTEAGAVQNNTSTGLDPALDPKAFLDSLSIPPPVVVSQITAVDDAKQVHTEPMVNTTLPMPALATSQPPSPVVETGSVNVAASSPSVAASIQMQSPSMLSAGANGLPPPPTALFLQNQFHPLPAPPTFGSTLPPYGEDDGGFFPPELEGPFDEFLREERSNMNEGNWDKFPDGSRLFVGTLHNNTLQG